MAVSSTHAPVKVVYINTQYVETDQLSFKSVVQSLTGKDTVVASVEDSSFAAQKRKNCGGSGGRGDSVSILSKDLGTVDFDRLLFELPSTEWWRRAFGAFGLYGRMDCVKLRLCLLGRPAAS